MCSINSSFPFIFTNESCCPAKIKWKSSGKIIAQGHYPTIFIKTYDSENNAIESIIVYTGYFNSELGDEDTLKIPKEGLKFIEEETLKEFVEEGNVGSYKIVYSSPFSDCETEEVIEFTIKESMSIFDKISEFFRWVF